MRGQRYEINITAKDNYYKVEVLKNGWRLLAAEGDYNTVNARLSEVYSRRVNTKQFNDDTFSEPTLYGILLDKYDNLLGRTPVIYFDINGETDKPFTKERTEYVLDFLRQDGFDKKESSMPTK